MAEAKTLNPSEKIKEESAENLEKVETSQKQEKKSKKTSLFKIENSKRSSIIKVAVVGIIALFLFSLVINSYVQLNEVYTQISSANTTLNEMRSSNVRMQTELEGQASIRNIKEYAENQLGLQKLDQSQIQYIQIQTEDRVVIEEPEQNIFVRIKRKFNDFIEYLRG
ncbi:MAG: hypothetical protein IJZ64_04495 [Ruminococcus sp.]|nr:hypothetical protein [Ruminococcus sp.]